MKKYLILILALALCVVLCACNSNSAGVTDATDDVETTEPSAENSVSETESDNHDLYTKEEDPTELELTLPNSWGPIELPDVEFDDPVYNEIPVVPVTSAPAEEDEEITEAPPAPSINDGYLELPDDEFE